MTKLTYIFAGLLLYLTLQARAQDLPYITTTGYGEYKVEPDEAKVLIAIELRNEDAQELRRQIDNSTSHIIAYLKKQGVENKDITTTYVNINPYYSDDQANTGKTTPDYYDGQKSMTFLLKNLTNYDPIMAGLYDLGLNRLDGIYFQVSNEEDKKIEALKRATENARRKAETMATALGVEVGNIYYVTDTSYGGGGPVPAPPMMADAAMAAGSASETSSESSVGPSISGGEILYSASINVVFYIIQ